jgi:hypothetical protein
LRGDVAGTSGIGVGAPTAKPACHFSFSNALPKSQADCHAEARKAAADNKNVNVWFSRHPRRP